MMSEEIEIVDRRLNAGVYIPLLLDDMKLDPYAVRVYLRLSRRASLSGVCFEKQDAMATACCMSVRQLRDSLGVLCSMRMVELEPNRGFGQRNRYVMTDVNEWVPQYAAPHADKDLSVRHHMPVNAAPHAGCKDNNKEDINNPSDCAGQVPPGDGNQPDLFGDTVPAVEPIWAITARLVNKMHTLSGRNFRPTDAVRGKVKHCLGWGATEESLDLMVEYAHERGKSRNLEYFTPHSLFTRDGFDRYHESAKEWKRRGKPRTGLQNNNSLYEGTQAPTDDSVTQNARMRFFKERGRAPKDLDELREFLG